MRKIFERLKFSWLVYQRQTPFWVNGNCDYLAVEHYNPLTDKVSYRLGRFGSCSLGPYPTMDRPTFLSYGERPGWSDRRF